MLYLFKIDNKTPKEHSSCFYWCGKFRPNQMSLMEHFCENSQLIKSFIIYILQGPKCALGFEHNHPVRIGNFNRFHWDGCFSMFLV